jgi:uncharacterized alkaline shock family protein YloU
MAEQSSTPSSRAVAHSGDSGDNPLKSDRGTTSIADAVVSKVAGIATREVGGVHNLGGGVSRALGSVTQRVAVEVGEREAAVDLTVVIEYGESVPQVSQAIRENVIKRIEGITGLKVTEVNVTVNDLYFPGDDVEEPEPARVS